MSRDAEFEALYGKQVYGDQSGMDMCEYTFEDALDVVNNQSPGSSEENRKSMARRLLELAQENPGVCISYLWTCEM